MISYPLLPTPLALGVVQQILQASPSPGELRAILPDVGTDISYYETSKRRADVDHLREIQDGLRAVAANHGWPAPLTRRTGPELDRELAPRVHTLLRPVPAEAAQEEMWNYIALRVVPDLTVWRFPNTKDDPAFERWLGRPRNAIRRLWWRSEILGEENAGRLLEDETVGIMERAFRGDRRVARMIADVHLDGVTVSSPAARTEVLREAMKRLLRLSYFVALDAMPPDDLRELIGEAIDQARDSVISSGPAAESAAPPVPIPHSEQLPPPPNEGSGIGLQTGTDAEHVAPPPPADRQQTPQASPFSRTVPRTRRRLFPWSR